ncbi:glycogen debranching protein GlgX [uncultured Ferrimonas sp.]|uniref:glycogen debranching protein GlgX n=1 Tax=uncultured Ferrimonas sp. TaxID=432640 RepID=UPI0026079F74|nr:glycogen debranching protein GlgX [uncultured Ferrimonas sp.]
MPCWQGGSTGQLGASVQDNGINFALFSAHACAVTLCLFDDNGNETARWPMHQGDGHIWHGLLVGGKAGQHYGYRVDGNHDPSHGHCFDPNKLLLDPYARRLAGPLQLAAICQQQGDNSQQIPKCVVEAERPALATPKPQTPLTHSVIYELNLKGFSQLNPLVPPALRGTIAALAQPTVIAHLQRLGVTAVELLPVAQFGSEAWLADKGLSNYWGYNSVAFFVPHRDYCPGGIDQFRATVETLHQAGIEVLLDVVFNHTAEGDEHGPTLSFRGIDNRSYYRLTAAAPMRYLNDSGCGNSMDLAQPMALRLVTDCLRYWSHQLGVDGFRFDLACSLGRDERGFHPNSALLQAIGQDPQLAQLKLIAEPWDLGVNGYQLGQFPAPWSEWNDHFRDGVRRFWRGDSAMLPQLAKCLHGSAEQFEHNGRGPVASINFITSHDGFTLRDLVSYQQRHNHANGENNRDGHSANYSSNGGVEGPSEQAPVRLHRLRRSRNLLATMMLSQGVPMLLAGDEFGHSQQGNNNGYCQDNALSWLTWPEWPPFADFIAQLTSIRRQYSQFQQPRYNHGDPQQAGLRLQWWHPNGAEMTEPDWQDPQQQALQVLMQCRGSPDLLLLLNAADINCDVHLPAGQWQPLLDTHLGDAICVEPQSSSLTLQAQSLLLLHRVLKKELHHENADPSVV